MNWRGASLSPPTLKSRGVERVDDSSLLALLTFYFADAQFLNLYCLARDVFSIPGMSIL